MSSEKFKEINVFIKIIGNSPLQGYVIKKLNPDNRLSEISNDDEFGELKREDEEKFPLNEIITVENGLDTLYLKRIYWEFLNRQHKLDYGRIMSFDGIKIAKKQAYKISKCELKEINSFKKDHLEFESKEDWMKKTNLFFDIDGINITNFVKLGLSIGSLRDKSFNKEVMSTYQYTEIGKVSLKFNKENLKLTEEFEKDVIDAIKSKSPGERFRKITEDYGQLIPTEVILGGRVYINDVKKSSISLTDISNNATGNIGFGSSNANVGINFNNSETTSKFYNFNNIRLLGGSHPESENFDSEYWIKSLKDYQHWECIEFRNPISIFQLLTDDLRKQTFESIGKRILHTSTEDCVYHLNEYGRHHVFELQDVNILEIIDDEEVACDVFASVYEDNKNSKNVFFNCQILREPSAKPSIIIHGFQNKFKQCKYNLKVRIMVIGYDTNFNFILPNPNTVGVELIKDVYDPQKPSEFHSIPLQRKLDSMLAKNIPFFGIPVLENFIKFLIIGHNFRKVDDEHKIDIFSYCLEKKCYVNLPKIIFYTFIIASYPNTDYYDSLPFKLKTRFVDLNTSSINPKCVSLYLSKNNNYRPMFLNQKINQIKIKYVSCKCKKTCNICKNKTSWKENDAECILFG